MLAKPKHKHLWHLYRGHMFLKLNNEWRNLIQKQNYTSEPTSYKITTRKDILATTKVLHGVMYQHVYDVIFYKLLALE